MKLARFADESGTVALDGFFLVAVVIMAQEEIADLTDAFTVLEKSSDRAGRKWVRSNESRKGDFLAGLEPTLDKIQPLLWRAQAHAGDLVALTVTATADAGRKSKSYTIPHWRRLEKFFQEI